MRSVRLGVGTAAPHPFPKPCPEHLLDVAAPELNPLILKW